MTEHDAIIEKANNDALAYCADHGLYHVDTMREDENGDYELRGAAEIATMYTALGARLQKAIAWVEEYGGYHQCGAARDLFLRYIDADSYATEKLRVILYEGAAK